MKHTRTLLTTIALLATTATTATAATVGKQETIRPPAKAPVTFPGTGKARGETLGGKDRVVSREVTLTGREKVNFNITCPSGTTHAGLGARQGVTDLGFNVLRPRVYTGKRTVRVQAYGRVAQGDEVTGTIYALCR